MADPAGRGSGRSNSQFPPFPRAPPINTQQQPGNTRRNPHTNPLPPGYDSTTSNLPYGAGQHGNPEYDYPTSTGTALPDNRQFIGDAGYVPAPGGLPPTDQGFISPTDMRHTENQGYASLRDRMQTENEPYSSSTRQPHMGQGLMSRPDVMRPANRGYNPRTDARLPEDSVLSPGNPPPRSEFVPPIDTELRWVQEHALPPDAGPLSPPAYAGPEPYRTLQSRRNAPSMPRRQDSESYAHPPPSQHQPGYYNRHPAGFRREQQPNTGMNDGITPLVPAGDLHDPYSPTIDRGQQVGPAQRLDLETRIPQPGGPGQVSGFPLATERREWPGHHGNSASRATQGQPAQLPERRENQGRGISGLGDQFTALRVSEPMAPFVPQGSDHPPRMDRSAILFALLSAFRNRGPGTPDWTTNQDIVDYLNTLLSGGDYRDIITHISTQRDAADLVDLIVQLFDKKLITQLNSRDIARRARHVAMKLGQDWKTIPNSLFLDPHQVHMQNTFSYGGSADVHKGNFCGYQVAIKQIRQSSIDKDFCRESLAWRTLSHKYLLELTGLLVGPSLISFVSPFMVNGTLRGWRRNSSPPVSEIRRHMWEVSEGLRYLHEEDIVHGDIHGNNILLGPDRRVKIADFGLSRHSEATATSNSAMCHHFTAPELFVEADDALFQRTKATDVYAFACLYYEIQFGELPFSNSNMYTISRKVKNGERPKRLVTPPLDDWIWGIIEESWHQDPGSRLKMKYLSTMLDPRSPNPPPQLRT